MIIKIKKGIFKPTSIGSKILLSMIIFYMISSLLIYTINLPRSILYLGDLLNVSAFIYAIKISPWKGKIRINAIFLCMWIFIIICFISAFVNLVPVILFLWGMRNNFRYFMFFFSCYKILKKKDIDILLKIIELAFWISIPLCTYQALFVTYGADTIVGDMVGGIFYGFAGVNAPLNVILVVHISSKLIKYFNNKISFKNLIITISLAIYISALAELKVFLVEFVIIVFFIIILRGISIKTVLITVLSVFILSVFASMLTYFNGTGRNNYNEILSISGLINYATKTQGYDGVGDLNRMTAIPVLYNQFLDKDLFRTLFGIGLGNADYSSGFSFLQSKFYLNYSYMHYHYFTAPWMFLETGILGLISFLAIFFSVYTTSNKVKTTEIEYIQLTKITSIIMIFLTFYNTSLRGEHSSYLLYMLLSIPFAIRNTEYKGAGIEYD